MTCHEQVVGLAAVIAMAAACGDNGDRCGTGTVELDGVCTAGPAAACGDGTKLENGLCVIDPRTCQAGTVLIAGQCVDPTTALTVDLEESAEPNGRAIAAGVEVSEAPAGTITLRPLGTAFIVHGQLVPFRDSDGDGQLDPDIDTYLVPVTGPTLLEISVDGVGGAQGGFYMVGDPDGAVPTYERYGLNLTGDTSRRSVFLPAGGTYLLAIADTRSLAIGQNPPRPTGAGGTAGVSGAEYYASITARELPTPSALTVTGSVATQTGTLATDEVKLFSAALGAGGPINVHDTMTGAAAASLAVINAGQFVGYADEIPATTSAPAAEAEVSLSSAPGDTALIAVDAVYNFGPAPEPFTLTVTVTQAAAAVP